jgi:hypothetical protein
MKPLSVMAGQTETSSTTRRRSEVFKLRKKSRTVLIAARRRWGCTREKLENDFHTDRLGGGGEYI